MPYPFTSGFAFIQNQHPVVTGALTLSIPMTATKKDNLLVVNLKFSSGTPASLGVTDNLGNAYALALGPASLSGTINYQFYGVQVNGGVTTVTVSWTNTANCRASVDEFTGGMTTNATVFDKAVSNSGTGAASAVTLSPTTPGELIVAGISTPATTITPDAAYTSSYNGAGNFMTQFRLTGTTSETAPCTWLASGAWVEVAGAYIPAPAVPNFGGAVAVVL